MPDSSNQDFMVQMGPTMGLPAALRDLGFDPQKVLRECGFDIEVFANPDNLISFVDRGRLLARCAKITQCPYLGLLVGQNSSLRSLGLLGLLARNSRDVRTAVKNLVRYFHLITHGAMLELQEKGSIAIFSYHVNQTGSPANDQVGAGAVAVMFNLFLDLCGPGWKPDEAWFMHKKPVNTEPYRKFFQTHLQFDADQNAIVFQSSWLNLPLTDVDPQLHELIQQQIYSLESRQGQDFPEQVREVMRTAILRGDCNAELVARRFSMHPRTFHRRLKAHGVGYRDLADAVGYSIAEQLLQETELTVGQIAVNMNYANARSFIRAFRRWSGITPARWRAQQKAKANE